jgi:hypothetical protein
VAQLAHALEDRPAVAPARRARLGWRADLITVVLGAWLMIGLFVDGWAHNNLASLETFFTPWHALFYSGFTATAAWTGWLVVRAQEAGHRGRAAVPLGYGLGVVGVVLFALGGVGDLLWHVTFGIEQSIDALFSPTHLLLFVGMALVLTSPFRAAWADDDPAVVPGYRAFLPVLLSLTLTTTLLAFFFMYWSPYLDNSVSAEPARWARGLSGDAAMHLEYYLLANGIATILVTNVFLLAPILLLLRRWRTPFGTATTLFTTVAVLSSALGEFEEPALIIGTLATGLAADALIVKLRPSVERAGALRAFATLTPAILWSVYFAIVALTVGLGWEIEMWSGVVVWAALSGLALSLVMVPPPVPDHSRASRMSP